MPRDIELWVVGVVLLGVGLVACGDEAIRAQPTADAGFDQRTTVGSTVTLDGTASRSHDGVSLEYSWRLLSAPRDSQAQLTGATSAHPTFVADEPGQYLLALSVTAGAVRSSPDVVGVFATATPPTAVAACASSTCRVLHGRTAGLVGSASQDPDGDPLTYLWEQITSVTQCEARCSELATCEPTDLVAPIADATSADTTFTAPSDRDLQVVFELVVTDQTSSDGACVAYVTTNTPPLIAAVAATPTTVDEGTPFALTATTGDSELDPLTHTWEQVSGISAGPLPSQEDASVTAPFVGADTFIEFRLLVSDGVDTTASDDDSPYAPGQVVRVNVRNVN